MSRRQLWETGLPVFQGAVGVLGVHGSGSFHGPLPILGSARGTTTVNPRRRERDALVRTNLVRQAALTEQTVEDRAHAEAFGRGQTVTREQVPCVPVGHGEWWMAAARSPDTRVERIS